MNDLRLIELSPNEIDEVSGGFPWAVASAVIFLGGAIVEGYNAYQEKKQKAEEQKKAK